MTRFIHNISKKTGLKPGTAVFVGQKKVERVRIHVIDYDEKNILEKEVQTIEECFPFKESPTVTWINVTGIHEVGDIEKLGNHFGFHPLMIEDIVNTGQRPKIEDAGDYVFVILKMLYNDEETDQLIAEQVSVLFGSNYVISFQEREGDVFDPVRERIRKTIPRIKFMGADYLAYTLIDAVVDHYFIILEKFGERIERIEEGLFDDTSHESLEEIHNLKRELIFMRKPIWPLREVVGNLDRMESPLIHDFTSAYLRDLYEHTIQVIDTVETFRDMVSGLHDLHLSNVSNRMNEVMKVLTIIATVFIPLSFLAGVYGMNFDTSVSPFNLPELGMRYGYPMFWIIALLVGGGLVWFFRRRGWI
jgi:magnesium transporter